MILACVFDFIYALIQYFTDSKLLKHALGDYEFNFKIKKRPMRLMFLKCCVIELLMHLYFIQIFVTLVHISEKDHLFEIKDAQISILLLLFVAYNSPFQKR